jgi:uncharacterized membrane protein YjgN (DUF898 family)
MARSKNFAFDGGAASYFVTSLMALLITCFTFGVGYPWALCMKERWRCHHTFISGRRLKFTGGGAGLIGEWITWLLLLIVTVGIYSFWLVPALNRWITEHTDFADA